jgi:hypothetical protein
MCEFVSFIVTTDGRILAGSLSSHEGIAAGYGIAPGDYREAEWTRDDDGASLVIRLEPVEDREAEIEWREKVFRRFTTRKALLKGITEGRSGGTHYHLRDGKLHRVDGPAVECADGTRVWWLEGKPHRIDGPAFEHADGTREWWLEGKLHRVDGTAVEECDPC